MFCSLVLTELLFFFFHIPSSSHNVSLFFFSLPPYLLASHVCTLHLAPARFTCFMDVSSLVSSSLPPLVFCFHLLLPLPPIPACFHHHHLFPLAYSHLLPPSSLVFACLLLLTSTITICSYLFLPSSTTPACQPPSLPFVHACLLSPAFAIIASSSTLLALSLTCLFYCLHV